MILKTVLFHIPSNQIKFSNLLVVLICLLADCVLEEYSCSERSQYKGTDASVINDAFLLSCSFHSDLCGFG